MSQVPESPTTRSTGPAFVLVFFGPHRDLVDAVEKVIGRRPNSRFVCILGRNEDSAKVRMAWRAHVEPRFPSAALITVHDNHDRIVERLADLASVMRVQNADAPVEVALMLGPPGPLWSAVRQAWWLRAVRKAVAGAADNCVVERFE